MSFHNKIHGKYSLDEINYGTNLVKQYLFYFIHTLGSDSSLISYILFLMTWILVDGIIKEHATTFTNYIQLNYNLLVILKSLL